MPAGVVTLPDGDVLIVGGVAHNGQGGWQALPDRRAEYDNPTRGLLPTPFGMGLIEAG